MAKTRPDEREKRRPAVERGDHGAKPTAPSALRTLLDREVANGSTSRAAADAFIATIESSAVLARLRAGDLQDQMQAKLIELALVDAVLDPSWAVARTLVPAVGPPDGADFQSKVERTKKLGEAARLLDQAEQPGLARATRRRALQPFKPPADLGAPMKPANRGIYELERVLRADQDLSVSERHRLVAEIVSEFFSPIDAEQVRLRVRGAKNRADCRAKKLRVIPRGVVLTVAEATLIEAGLVKRRSAVELVREGALSGARAFYDPWLDAR